MRARVPLACCCVLLASSARAQDTQTITLVDGTTVTGEVVEYVAGDHVTVKLPDGDSRRIEWRNLASGAHAPRVDTGPAPSAAPAALPAQPVEVSNGPLEWSPRLGELRPELDVDRESGWSPIVQLGVQGGYASPFGYLSLVADYFPWLWPALRGIGLELTVAMPVADEPVTLGETLLLGFDIGIIQFGFGAGFAEAFTRTIVPGDHPGVSTLFTADLSHLAIDITKQIWIRGRWGLALFMSGDYCTTHPEACPQLSNFIPFYGDAALGWTFDFGSSPAGATR